MEIATVTQLLCIAWRRFPETSNLKRWNSCIQSHTFYKRDISMCAFCEIALLDWPQQLRQTNCVKVSLQHSEIIIPLKFFAPFIDLPILPGHSERCLTSVSSLCSACLEKIIATRCPRTFCLSGPKLKSLQRHSDYRLFSPALQRLWRKIPVFSPSTPPA